MDSLSDNLNTEAFSTFPILKQVDIFINAIKDGIDIRKTLAWKTLPKETKGEIFKICDERMKVENESTKGSNESTKGSNEATKGSNETTNESTKGSNETRAYTVKSSSSKETSCSSTPSQPKESKVMTPNTKTSKTPHWTVIQANVVCKCGITHPPLSKSPHDTLIEKCRLIMISFGDFEAPCNTSASYIHDTVKEYMKNAIVHLLELSDSKTISFESIQMLFPDVSKMYLRWKELKSLMKSSEDDLQSDADALEEELEEIIDESHARFDNFPGYLSRFKDRIAFADRRTREMEHDQYLRYSSYRESNFGSLSTFSSWLQLGSSLKRPVYELLTYIGYDRIGLLVEESIKAIHSGNLIAMDRPIFENEYRSAAASLMTIEERRKLISLDNSDTSTLDGDAASDTKSTNCVKIDTKSLFSKLSATLPSKEKRLQSFKSKPGSSHILKTKSQQKRKRLH